MFIVQYARWIVQMMFCDPQSSNLRETQLPVIVLDQAHYTHIFKPDVREVPGEKANDG